VSDPELSMTDYERGVAAGRSIERAAVVGWLRECQIRMAQGAGVATVAARAEWYRTGALHYATVADAIDVAEHVPPGR
jgi:hypothetical protein